MITISCYLYTLLLFWIVFSKLHRKIRSEHLEFEMSFALSILIYPLKNPEVCEKDIKKNWAMIFRLEKKKKKKNTHPWWDSNPQPLN